MELVADRFVVMHDGRAVDLSSGEEIVLLSSTAGGPSSRRAGRFDATDGRSCTILQSHASSTTASSVRCGGSKRGAAVLHGGEVRPPREQAIGQAAAFLRANGLTEGTLSAHAAGSRDGRAIAVPGGDAGYDAEQRLPPDDLTLAACGLALASRPAVDAVAELFTHPGSGATASRGVMGRAGQRSRNGDRRTCADGPAARLRAAVVAACRLQRAHAVGRTGAAHHRSRRRRGRVAGAHGNHSSIAWPACCVAIGFRRNRARARSAVGASRSVHAGSGPQAARRFCRHSPARRGGGQAIPWPPGKVCQPPMAERDFQASNFKSQVSAWCDRRGRTSGRTIASVRGWQCRGSRGHALRGAPFVGRSARARGAAAASGERHPAA